MAKKAVKTVIGKRKPRAKARKVVSRVDLPKKTAKSRLGITKAMGTLSLGKEWLNESDFVKMTLDPCNAKLTKSPFGSTQNAYLWRVNYRSVVAAAPNGNLMLAFYPLGLTNYGAATAPQIVQSWTGLADNATMVAAGTYIVPPVIGQFQSMAAQVRITAGCVGLQYIGSAQNAAGRLYGWEGQGDEVFLQYSGTAVMQSRQAPCDFMNSGRVLPITAGVEASLNYTKAPPQQLGYVDPKVARTDVYTPMAVVGVSGGAASANYEMTLSFVVEWTPLLNEGIANDNVTLVKPGAAERIANALKMVAPLLVRAGTSALGGYANVVAPGVKLGYNIGKALMSG